MLEHSHVVEWAVYTANGKPASKYATGRLAKPVAVVGNGIVQRATPESGAGRSRTRSTVGTKPIGRLPGDWEETNLLCAIKHASVPYVEGVGTLRMTHRADTGNTKAWRQQINGESRDTIFLYRQVAEALGMQVPELAGVSTSEAAAA